jgi:hypothetical protein
LEHPGRVHRRRRGAADLPWYVSAAANGYLRHARLCLN